MKKNSSNVALPIVVALAGVVVGMTTFAVTAQLGNSWGWWFNSDEQEVVEDQAPVVDEAVQEDQAPIEDSSQNVDIVTLEPGTYTETFEYRVLTPEEAEEALKNTISDEEAEREYQAQQFMTFQQKQKPGGTKGPAGGPAGGSCTNKKGGGQTVEGTGKTPSEARTACEEACAKLVPPCGDGCIDGGVEGGNCKAVRGTRYKAVGKCDAVRVCTDPPPSSSGSAGSKASAKASTSGPDCSKIQTSGNDREFCCKQAGIPYPPPNVMPATDVPVGCRAISCTQIQPGQEEICCKDKESYLPGDRDICCKAFPDSTGCKTFVDRCTGFGFFGGDMEGAQLCCQQKSGTTWGQAACCTYLPDSAGCKDGPNPSSAASAGTNASVKR